MKILIARDKAFNFLYRANVDALRNVGDVKFFSPLHDSNLPKCDLLYLPGGYPELFSSELSNNRSLRNEIKEYAELGGMMYAECGGFMFLCNSIDDKPMCGVLPIKATMDSASLHLGYRQMVVGTHDNEYIIKGHEFHYSDIITDDTALALKGIICERNQLSAKGMPTATAIFRYKNVIAGYTHWYWAENGFPFFNLKNTSKENI